MDPREDQYLAAVAHARSVVESHRAAGWDAYLPDVQPAPGAVIAWARDHAQEFENETLRRCGHIDGGLSQPVFVLGREPNVLLCGRCLDAKSNDMAQAFASAGQNHANCDLCGIPEPITRLTMCVFNVAAVVFRGFACDACLAPNPFVKTTQ